MLNRPQRLLISIGVALLVTSLAAKCLPVVGVGGGKLDNVLVLYESDKQPVAEVNVIQGSVANAWRKLDKFDAIDQHQIPDADKPTLEPIIKKVGVPALVLIRGGKVVHYEKLPGSGESLAAVVEKWGGI